MSPTIKFSPLQQYNEFKAEVVRLWNSPPLNYYTPRITAFWSKYGFKVKLGIVALFVLMLISFGINLGKGISQTNRTPEYVPSQIPTLSVPTTVPVSSKFLDLKNKIQAFSTLLPDPAPPTVDEAISLNKNLQER